MHKLTHNTTTWKRLTFRSQLTRWGPAAIIIQFNGRRAITSIRARSFRKFAFRRCSVVRQTCQKCFSTLGSIHRWRRFRRFQECRMFAGSMFFSVYFNGWKDGRMFRGCSGGFYSFYLEKLGLMEVYYAWVILEFV